MKEILITSSVLIAALLALRLLFHSTISRRAQYALWALVLVRLLIPVNLPTMFLSVLNAGTEAQNVMVKSMDREVYVLPLDRTPASDYPAAEQVRHGDLVPHAESVGYPVLSSDGKTVTKYAERLTLGEALAYVWKAGIAVMACFFLMTNLRFWLKLRKNRTRYTAEGSKRPVYLCEGLSSPCLFGLFRPAIYLTPAAACSPDSLRYVIAHEETHARHLDPLWSLLRCVCLTVYWFDPLVWAAAVAAKTDCELACDEGALRRLGDGERFPYGQTLLSLIPVRKGAANPLLSATTMTAGRRQLKDRITRIAEKRKTAGAAILFAVVLVLAVSACTFTGANKDKSRPLTGSELKYFNEEFFNGKSFNIHNQFLNSLYDAPEKIDLFELFYCGIPDREIPAATASKESAEELRQVYGDTLPDCATYKLTTAEMDSLLSKYTGLTLAKTNRVSLQKYTYLPEYDAYYFAHGDTNYRVQVAFTAGKREEDLVRLYYNDSFMADGWKCVTLRESDGSYRFISNQHSQKPAIPTVLPKGKPVLTISLDGLKPYQAPAVTVERHIDDCAEWLHGGWRTGDHIIQPYRSTDGKSYAAIIYKAVAGNDAMTTWDVGCFLTLPEKGSFKGTFFSDLFGHDGIVISYPGMRSEQEGTTFNDYYYITGDGVPVLLARAYGTSAIIDMDGDGENELVSDTQLFYGRNGQVYEADLPALLKGAWPGMNSWDYASLDANGRSLTVRGFATMPGWSDGNAYFKRYLYFGGKRLLIYKDSAAVDHVQEGIDVPKDVLAAARSHAQAAFQASKNGAANALKDQSFNDWRINSLYRVNIDSASAQWPDLNIEVYSFVYQFHSAKPEDVVVAGGAYVDEEGWFGGFYTAEGPYLVFQVRGGQRILLDSAIPGDENQDSPAFRADLKRTLERNGLLPSS